MEDKIWPTIISGIGVLLAFVALIWQSYLTRQQMKLNFFADYTKRYQEIILNLPSNINADDFKYKKLSKLEKSNTLRYMRAYFDLCSEQYFLNKTKKLDKKVWKEWKEGMSYTFSKEAFKKAWEILNNDSRFFVEFTEWLKTEGMID